MFFMGPLFWERLCDGILFDHQWNALCDQFIQNSKRNDGINPRSQNQSPLTICYLLSGSGEMASATFAELAGYCLQLYRKSQLPIFSLTASWSSALLFFQGCSLLQRSKSFCPPSFQTEIEKLLDGEDGSNELIGDFTKVRKTVFLAVLVGLL